MARSCRLRAMRTCTKKHVRTCSTVALLCRAVLCAVWRAVGVHAEPGVELQRVAHLPRRLLLHPLRP